MAKYEVKTPLQWVMNCREFVDEESALYYCKEFDGKSLDELILDFRQYSHQIVYGSGIDELMIYSSYYLNRKNYKGYVKFIKYLKYPILISSLFEFISDSEICVKLFNKISVDSEKESVFVAMLLRQRWLDLVCRKVVALSERGKLLDNVKSALDQFLQFFSMENTCQWLADFPCSHSTKFVNNETLQTDFITNAICSYVQTKVDGNTIDLNIRKFNYLMFVSEPILKSGNRTDDLWKAIVDSITKDKFYWKKELDNNTIADMRIVSRVIANKYHGCPDSLLSQFCTKVEGYGTGSWGAIYNSISIESFVLSSLLLLVELEEFDDDNKSSIFLRVSHHLLKQCHACDSLHIVEEYFLIPLILAELIASQILKNACYDWEESIVNSNLPLRIVTRVISAGHIHNNTVLTLLSNRKRMDWEIEKTRLSIMKSRGIDIIKSTETSFVMLGV